MLPYWVLFSVFALGAANSQLTPRLPVMRISPLLVLAALLTMLLIGLRYKVGADWGAYQDIFSAATYMSIGSVLAYGDPGYMLINAAAHALGFEIWFVNLVCAVIFTSGLLIFARAQPNPWLAFAVAVPYLVIVVAMGYTRQAAAIGIILIAIGQFQRGQFARFVFSMLLAATLHKSSIVAFPLIVLSTVRYKFVIYSVAAVIGSTVFFVFLDAVISRVLRDYLTSEMSSSGAGVRVAMNVVPAVLFLAFQHRFSLDEQERVLWRNFSLAALAMVAALGVLPSTTVVDRAALYLVPLQVFTLSRLPCAFPASGRPSGVMTLLVLAYSAAVQSVWLIFASHSEYWVPYRLFPFQ